MLPRDAMHKRGLCRRAMSVRLSVLLSDTFVYCIKPSNYMSPNFFHHRIATPF